MGDSSVAGIAFLKKKQNGVNPCDRQAVTRNYFAVKLQKRQRLPIKAAQAGTAPKKFGGLDGI
jgi:hypothetical protein